MDPSKRARDAASYFRTTMASRQAVSVPVRGTATTAPSARAAPDQMSPRMNDRFLAGRTALVTGSTSGIGLAIATALGRSRRRGRDQRPGHCRTDRRRTRRRRGRGSVTGATFRCRPARSRRDRIDDGRGRRLVAGFNGRRWTSWSTTPASSMRCRSPRCRCRSGTTSSPSTSAPRSMRCGWRCRAWPRAASAA